jgi:uncharacterized protein YraI
MRSFPARAGFRRGIVIGVALATLLAPSMTFGGALAQSALGPGASGMVANSGGQPVLLRATPGFDGEVVAAYPEGTPADIIEGPIAGGDGVTWIGVSIGGVAGYMVADYLASSAPASEPAPVETTAAPVEMGASADPAEEIPAPAASLGDLPANPISTADLNLRAGPSYDDAVLTIIPAGTPLTVTGDWSAGFAGVTYQGQFGWVDTSWVGAGDAASPPADVTLLQEAAPAEAAPAAEMAADDDSALVSDLTAPAGEAARAIDTANLRLGPADADEVLRVLPAGAPVIITGATTDGWTPVWYNGTWGFIRADLLSVGASDAVTLAQDAAPADQPDAAPDSGALEATTLSDVNLRAAPDTTAAILTTIPAGVALTPLVGPEAGYYQVAFDGQSGWVIADALQVSTTALQKADRQKSGGKVEGSEPAENARTNSGGIIWPVSGGTWQIMQGYNGSSHQNQDGLWQYYYSLDLVREDGETAGQTIVAPVNGVVTWTDPSSGGISIDMGDGHAVALFHVTFDGALQAGTPVSQGQALGKISGSGGPGFSGTAHVHFTLWSSSDDGNWDRHAEPFTGKYSIEGMSFPDIGGSSQYAGTEFTP